MMAYFIGFSLALINEEIRIKKQLIKESNRLNEEIKKYHKLKKN
jgi:hypothetical protein